MRPLRPVTFRFVEPGQGVQIGSVGQADTVQHIVHAGIEVLGREHLVVASAIVDQRCRVPRHRRPVNIRVHRVAELDRIPHEQKELSERLDLIERLVRIVGDLHVVMLGDHRHHIAPIALARALDAADLVQKTGNDPCVGVAHTGERSCPAFLHRIYDDIPGVLPVRIAVPLPQPVLGVVNVSLEKPPVVAVIEDLPDARTGAFRHDPVDQGPAFVNPDARKFHLIGSFATVAALFLRLE